MKKQSKTKSAVRARRTRARVKVAAAAALARVSMDPPPQASATPFSDVAAGAARAYFLGEKSMNVRFATETAREFEERLDVKTDVGLSGWWNPMLTTISKLEGMARSAVERGDWLDAAILCAMVHSRRKA